MINRVLILYIFLLWFVISFITNLIGPLMPTMIKEYKLSLALAGFLPFSFFLAYGIASIPAGIFLENRGSKSTLYLAFGIVATGSFLIASITTYQATILGLFLIGIGMAMLQVILNPLLRVTVGEHKYTTYSVAAQLVFGLASFASPIVYTTFLSSSQQEINTSAWPNFYWCFTAAFLVLYAITSKLQLPSIRLLDQEKVGRLSDVFKLLKDPKVQQYFVAVICYVGIEQSISNWVSEFLKLNHGLNPDTTGAKTVSQFWGAMAFGCLVGLPLLKVYKAKTVFSVFSILLCATLSIALFSNAETSVLAFTCTGFCLSVMFSVIFAQALNSMPNSQGTLSGILCSGILGGAVMPMLVGIIGDYVGLKFALSLLCLPIIYNLIIIGLKKDQSTHEE